MKRVIAIIMILTTLNLYCQEHEPEPYQDGEFPQVMEDVRRGSVVFAGSLPIMYMYTAFMCDSFLMDTNFYGGLPDESSRVEFKLVTTLILSGIVMLIDLFIEKFIKE